MVSTWVLARSGVLLAALLVLSGAAATAPQGFQVVEDAKLTATDGGLLGDEPAATAMDGDTVVGGAPFDDQAAGTAGAVYVFLRAGTAWSQQAKLLASDASSADYLGWSVAIYGDTIVAGAPRANLTGVDEGAAYVFVRQGTLWSQQAKLVAGDAGSHHRFGTAAAILGDTAVIGAPQNDGLGGLAGAAYVFTRSGTTWTESQKLDGLDTNAGDQLGFAVAVDQDTVLVGAHRQGSAPRAGTAYVFRFDGTGWAQESQLFGSDGSDDDEFGRAVSLDGDTAVIGAWSHSHDGLGRGAAYVFERAGTTWSETAELVACSPELLVLDRFGWAVAVADGAGSILVGSPWSYEVGPQSGTTYLFRRSGSDWNVEAKLSATDARFLQELGRSVDFSGSDVLVGSVFGAAYVYTEPPARPGVPACFGDGTGAPCPCGNDATVRSQGCRHSGGVGMRIVATGTASIAADDLELVVCDAPEGNTGIFYSGQDLLAAGVFLYDGLQCVGGPARRFRGRFQIDGTVSDTGFVAQDPSGSYFVPGASYAFQYWSRDVAAGPSPCATGANLSPAIQVLMLP